MFHTVVPQAWALAPQAERWRSVYRLTIGLVLLAAASGGCAGGAVAHSTDDFPAATGFRHHEIHVDGQVRSIYVFVPKNYRPDKHYPAILFLHGIFESGHGDNCLAGGLGPVIARDPSNWPFITIFPQSESDWRGEAHNKLAMASLDLAEKVWSIDQDRVILAGLSVGGLGTWEIGAKNRDRFAALVPVSGLSAREFVGRLINLPVWAFACQDDPFVNANSSVQMCQAIRNLGGRARLTEFPGMGHDCWDKVIAQSDLVKWMLAQRRQTVLAMR